MSTVEERVAYLEKENDEIKKAIRSLFELEQRFASVGFAKTPHPELQKIVEEV